MRLAPKLVAVACLAAIVATGCPPAAEPVAVHRPSLKNDPCAERLHDICGALLMYYATRRQLPPTPAALRSTAGVPLPPLVCPASGKPYVYTPAGVPIPQRTGRVVMYDPQPSHSGMRWAVLATPSPDGNITARVILVADKDLALPAH